MNLFQESARDNWRTHFERLIDARLVPKIPGAANSSKDQGRARSEAALLSASRGKKKKVVDARVRGDPEQRMSDARGKATSGDIKLKTCGRGAASLAEHSQPEVEESDLRRDAKPPSPCSQAYCEAVRAPPSWVSSTSLRMHTTMC